MKTKNKLIVKLALILAVILILTGFLNLSALAETPLGFKQIEKEIEGDSDTKTQSSTEGKSKNLLGSVLSIVDIDIEDALTTTSDYSWDGATNTLTISDYSKSYNIHGSENSV